MQPDVETLTYFKLEVCAVADRRQISTYVLLKLESLAAPSDCTAAHQGAWETQLTDKQIEPTVKKLSHKVNITKFYQQILLNMQGTIHSNLM